MLQHAAEPRTLRLPRDVKTLSLIDITSEITGLDAFDGHEQIWLGRDMVRGLTAIVAIHNMALGPALGGTRLMAVRYVQGRAHRRAPPIARDDL